MYNLAILEEYYKKYAENIDKWLPEDIIDVDIDLLKRFDLLNYHDPDLSDSTLTRYFHVIESSEKITLINEEFVVWIVPEKIGETTFTYTLVAQNNSDHPQLELCFVSSGVYNTSNLVLRVLEKFLWEIQENEEMLKKLAAE